MNKQEEVHGKVLDEICHIIYNIFDRQKLELLIQKAYDPAHEAIKQIFTQELAMKRLQDEIGGTE